MFDKINNSNTFVSEHYNTDRDAMENIENLTNKIIFDKEIKQIFEDMRKNFSEKSFK